MSRNRKTHRMISMVLLTMLMCSCKAKKEPALFEMASETGDDPVVDISTRTRGHDWESFLGPGRDGKSGETGILTDWSDGKLRVVWSRNTGTGYASGVVSKGRYFHFERIKDRATLHCLNAETGEKIWDYGYESHFRDQYGYDNGPRCAPVVDGHRVFIFGADGELHCVDVNSGERIWQINTSKVFGVQQNFFGVGSSPIVYGDHLLVMVGGSAAEADSGGLEIPAETGIVCFDKRTGKIVYGCCDDLASYSSPIIARIHDKDWCLAFCRENLVGFDPATGQVRDSIPWRALIRESVNASTPIVKENQVFISECYGPGSALISVSKDDQFKVVWEDVRKGRQKSMLLHWNTPVLTDGYLYGSSGRQSGNAELRCVQWETGDVKWGEPGLKRCSLTFVDNHMIVLGEYGDLLLIRANPEKMDEVTRYQPNSAADKNAVELKYPCWSAPIIAKGLMYLRTKDKVVCFELIPE